MGGPGILYNTLQGLSAAAALLALPILAREASRPGRASLEGWGWAFVALGLVMFPVGLHMSLAWPLENVPDEVVTHCCAADNIAFGEPAVFFGALLLVGGFALASAERRAEDLGRPANLLALARPLGFVAAVGGLSLYLIALAGAANGMWTAPEDEPIAGRFADTVLETAYVTGAYLLTGTAAVLAPFIPGRRLVGRVAGACAYLAGLAWLAITLSSYFGHMTMAS